MVKGDYGVEYEDQIEYDRAQFQLKCERDDRMFESLLPKRTLSWLEIQFLPTQTWEEAVTPLLCVSVFLMFLVFIILGYIL